MKNRNVPWAAIAGALLSVFVVWLFSAMARTEDANRIITTIAICALVGGAALAAGIGARRRASRRRTADATPAPPREDARSGHDEPSDSRVSA